MSRTKLTTGPADDGRVALVSLDADDLDALGIPPDADYFEVRIEPGVLRIE